MWIRSQNDYILANVNSLRICKCDIDGCIYYSIHGHYDRYEQELGIYSTKEKALKVLDEIQHSIMTEHQYHTDEANCTMRNTENVSNSYTTQLLMIIQMRRMIFNGRGVFKRSTKKGTRINYEETEKKAKRKF